MSVLRHLEQQVEVLLSNGRTDPGSFRYALVEEKLLDDIVQPLDITADVLAVQERMRVLNQGSTWGFYVEELERLKEGQWFGEDLIQLGMHLADKLPRACVLAFLSAFTTNTRKRHCLSALQMLQNVPGSGPLLLQQIA